MEDCYFEAAESDSTINQQKAGLKTEAQSVSYYLKDTLEAPTQASSHCSFERRLSVILNISMNTVRSQ